MKKATEKEAQEISKIHERLEIISYLLAGLLMTDHVPLRKVSKVVKIQAMKLSQMFPQKSKKRRSKKVGN